MVGAGIVADTEDAVAVVEILQRHCTLADTDQFRQAYAGRLRDTLNGNFFPLLPLTSIQILVITNGVLPDRFGGVFHLAEIRLQEGESLENALRRFKRKVQQEDIIKEVKRHSFYLKPGEKKRVKAALARKRARKKVRKEAD